MKTKVEISVATANEMAVRERTIYINELISSMKEGVVSFSKKVIQFSTSRLSSASSRLKLAPAA